MRYIITLGVLWMAMLAGCQKEEAVLSLHEISGMTDEQIEQKLIGVSHEKLTDAWGEPVWGLFGMDGEIFLLEDKRAVLVYYGGENRTVEEVRITSEAEPSASSTEAPLPEAPLPEVPPTKVPPTEAPLPEASPTEVSLPEASLSETPLSEVLLTEAPPICLQDALSSQMDIFQVQSGNYEWNYRKGEETVSLVACGTHPMDGAKEAERLTVPEYNKLEAAPYSISFSGKPDRISIREYAITNLGNVEAEPISENTCEETFLVDLKPSRIYEIEAVWEEGKFAERGYSGNAGYVVVTE